MDVVQPREDYDQDLYAGIDYRTLLGVSERPEPEEVFDATRAKLRGILGDAALLGDDGTREQIEAVHRASAALTHDRGRYLAYLRYHQKALHEEPAYPGHPF